MTRRLRQLQGDGWELEAMVDCSERQWAEFELRWACNPCGRESHRLLVDAFPGCRVDVVGRVG